NEINRAVQLGFISGFAEDNTFRPQASLTREQLVSIAMEGLGQAPQGAVSSAPYPDVPASRWSAAKIQKAQELGIVSGYPDGSFKPTQEVTRAELIAIMNKAAEYRNNGGTLSANQPGVTFADINGHWAQGTISTLSSYCGIATPLNEVGSSFFPNQAANRNYAAAAMVRLLDCTQTTPQ
ncbi:MAG: S-layer homology domain-containing protein, partial [Cyanobacteria bacterium J06635_11]